ncbi:MAG TPA: type IV secretion system DNA-binding domain-containing protein [Bellilinea sp.]|nr:type IV secretion system DNA-binding domain-containing protein [Bellilinea sp.]
MTSTRDGQFFLGKIFDMQAGKLTDELLQYDPADLTTHAVVTGMTGSGKTGMCIGLLEEAAIEGIPAIIIDPKGDLTNLLLHFPDLLPADFEPWIDPEVARREGKTPARAALSTAENWKKGLESWGLGATELNLLKDSVDFGVYTPGSSVGVPVNILSSFAAPGLPWDEHREILREKISTIVTALLGLIGLNDIDPLRSREHILLSNILENAWSKDSSLDLTELILQTQNPPFERLGAFPINNFFPAKDRFDLAMLLNNFLASPSFEIWREGVPLDIAKLLYSPDGKARHSIFYLAHLSEGERMFFVTLLFAAIESWMRSQRGTGALRALVYFDEILGYLPPVANPPSRPIMLRMLKQARAFGVGLLLATQNPVDVDYKGLSNAGTWFVGRLQTDQDKQRLLDGLDSAGGGLDRSSTDKLISNLGKRTFLLHNVHGKGPKVFQTRWALNFLAGPLTRSQIPQLLKLIPNAQQASAVTPAMPAGSMAAAPVSQVAARPSASPPSPATGSTTRPVIPTGVNEYFIPNNLAFSEALTDARVPAGAKVTQGGFLYRPALFAQAEVVYLARKYNLELNRQVSALPQEARGRVVNWDDFAWLPYKREELTGSALPTARFTSLPEWLADARTVNNLQSDFVDWVIRNGTIRVRANEALKVYAGPEVSTADFREMCSKAAKDAMQADVEKIEVAYRKKLETLEAKVKRQTMEVDSQQDELGQRRMEELGKGAELLFGLLGGRKRSVSSNLTKRRMTASAKADLKQEEAELEQLEKQLVDLENEQKAALDEVNERWAEQVNNEVEVPVTAYRKDVYLDFFGIAWLPYYVVSMDGQNREVPAFKQPVR